MLQADSILTTTSDFAGEAAPAHHGPLTPAQVISWLPKNATPAQKDSAVQSRIKPKPIHWSERPDTLHLPGHGVGENVYDVNIPQYYRENFFSDKEYYHPEITGGRQGLAGDPIPYSIAGDNVMTSLLLLCLMSTLVLVSVFRNFFGWQLKEFFYGMTSSSASIDETSNEVRMQLFICAQGCFLYAVVYFLYLKTYVTETFTIEQYQMIGLLSGMFAGYFLLKSAIYSFVNWVFFDDEKKRQWRRASLFITTFQATLLLPIVLVMSYFDMSFRNTGITLCVLLLCFKLLTIYKQQKIFFSQKGQLLGFFLYFCTLELVPLFMMWNALTIVSGSLKINF